LGLLAQDPRKGILNGKIAFLHVDGNSFGKIRHQHCTTPERRKKFDYVIQEEIRKPFMRELLTKARKDPDFQTKDANGRQALRLEVLLWGGDEMTLVVPAWKGLEVLELFYKHAQGKKFEDSQLTHRGAMIFCHHNAPILLIERLTENLLAQTKNDIADLEEKDATHYLVLESFDSPGGSLTDFLASYYGKKDERLVYSNLLLMASELTDLKHHLQVIVRNAPKNKVFHIIAKLRESEQVSAKELKEMMLKTVEPEQKAEVSNAILNIVGDVPERWYFIADLWDYAKEWK